MEEPKNIFMYSEKLTTGDKFVAVGDAVRAGANGQALFAFGTDHAKGKEFVRISWLESSGSFPEAHEKKIKEVCEKDKVTAWFMKLDAAIECLTDDIA